MLAGVKQQRREARAEAKRLAEEARLAEEKAAAGEEEEEKDDEPEPEPEPEAKPKRRRMSKEFREFLFYLVFLAVFGAVVFGPRGADPFFTRSALDQQFLGNDYDKGINYLGTASVSQVWQWIDAIMLPNVYPTAWYNDEPRRGDARRQITDLHNFRLGAARLRALRVKPCTAEHLTSYFQPLLGGDRCYPRYVGECASMASGETTEDTADWVNPHPGDTAGVLPAAIAYQDATATGEAPFFSPHTRISYCAGGQVVDLPSDLANASAVARALWNSTWVDRSVRALLFEVNLYNANTDMVTVLRHCVEMTAEGAIVPSYSVHIAPLLRLTRAVENDGVPMSTRVLLLLEGVLYVAVWGFVAREVRQVFVIRRKNAGLGFVGALRRYLSNGWNWLEVLNLSVFVVVMAKRYDVYEQVNDLAPQFATEPGRYFGELTVVAQEAKDIDNFNAFNAVLSFLKIFKYVRYNLELSQFVDTVTGAILEMGTLAIVIAVVSTAYAISFHVAFGAEIADYRDMPNSIFTLFKATLGDFDIDDIIHGRNYILGPVLFFTFILLMFFVILSMFLAIVDDAFDRVRSRVLDQAGNVAAKEPAAEAFNRAAAWMLNTLRWVLTCGCCRAKKVAPGGAGADAAAPGAGPLSRALGGAARGSRDDPAAGAGGDSPSRESKADLQEARDIESDDPKVAYAALHRRAVRLVGQLRSRQATLTDRLRALDAAVPSVAALRAAGSVSDIGAGESLD